MMFNAKLMLLVVMLWTGSLTLASSGHQSNMMRKMRGNPVCDKYELPENAVWITRANCEDNREFQCQPGYQSRVKTTCKRNGKWDLEPSCQAVKCSSGEEIENSDTETPSDIYGADFTFDCLAGFTKNGLNGTMTCGESGDWIVTTSCEERDKNYRYSNDTFVPPTYSALPPTPTSFNTKKECQDLCDNDNRCNIMFYPDEETTCIIYQYPLVFASLGLDNIDQCIEKCTEMSECRMMVSIPEIEYCFLYDINLEEIPDSEKKDFHDFFDDDKSFTIAENVN